MSTIDDIYVRLAEICGFLDHKPKKLRSDLEELIEAGKSKEEAILTLAVEKGLIVKEVRELVARGMSNPKAISEVAKNMKLDSATEEKVKEIEEKAQREISSIREKELTEPQVPPPESLVQGINFRDLLKYFVHGILYSVLGVVMLFVWVGVLLFLVVVGSILGLIIGIGVLLLIVGGINCIITSYLWFPVETSFWKIFLHGIVLFVALLIVNGILLIPNLVFPGIATTVITFIIGAFLDGIVGKTVAGIWREI